LRDQPLAVLVEIDEGEGCKMPVVILHDAAIAHLGITEHALQNAEWPLHLGSHPRLGSVLALLFFVHALLGLSASRSPLNYKFNQDCCGDQTCSEAP